MKNQSGRNRMKRMGAVLLSVFCVLAAVLVLQTSVQSESGEHVAQAATTQSGTGAAAVNAGTGQTGGGAGTAQATGNTGAESTGITQAGTLTVTWLDVGQGDAAVIQCGGQSMLIDGGKPEKSSYIYMRGCSSMDSATSM